MILQNKHVMIAQNHWIIAVNVQAARLVLNAQILFLHCP